MTTAVAVYSGRRSFAGGEGTTTRADTVVGLAADINIDNCMLQHSCRGNNTALNSIVSRGHLATDGDYIVIEWDIGFASQGSTIIPVVEWTVTEFEASSMESNIQRGTQGNTSDTTDITITAVTIDQSIYLTSDKSSQANPHYAGNEKGFDISLTSTTNLRYYYKGTAPETNEHVIAWQVIEFPAADVHIEHGITTYTDSTTTAITGFTTLGNMFVLQTGSEGGQNGFGTNGRASNQVKINSTSELGFNTCTVGTGVDLSCSWTVVELLGGGTVHKGELTMADTVGSVNGSFTAVDLDFATVMRGHMPQPNGYIDDATDDGVLNSIYNTEYIDEDGAGITIERDATDADWTQQYVVVEWVNGDGPSGLTVAGVTNYNSSATTTSVSQPHRVDAGTTLLILIISQMSNESITVEPKFGAASFTKIHSTTAAGNQTDMRNHTYALVSPTAGVDNITYTMSSSDNACHQAINCLRTEDASVAAATNHLSDDVNDSPTNTSVHSSAGTTGATLLFAGCFYGDDGNDSGGVTNDASFIPISSGNTGPGTTIDIAYYVAIKIAGAPDAITVTWETTDENCSQLIEILPASASANRPIKFAGDNGGFVGQGGGGFAGDGGGFVAKSNVVPLVAKKEKQPLKRIAA